MKRKLHKKMSFVILYKFEVCIWIILKAANSYGHFMVIFFQKELNLVHVLSVVGLNDCEILNMRLNSLT